MNVRRAAAEDFDAIADLWRQFDHEIPPPTHEGPADEEQELGEVREIIASEIAFVAEDDGNRGRFRARETTSAGIRHAHRSLRRAATRGEAASARSSCAQVLAAFRELGIEHFDLEVVASNQRRALPVRALGIQGRGRRHDRLRVAGSRSGSARRRLPRSARSIIQSDDLSAVEQAVRQFVPRLPGGSRGSIVAPPRGGWIAVYDDVCDRNPEMLRRLARELSDRIGAVTLLLGIEREELVRMILFERGRIVDEYLSVPEFYGPLPPGDVIGLAANPTVMSRLTGADPEAVRRVARTAPSPADLPPARELLAELAARHARRGRRDGLGRRAGRSRDRVRIERREGPAAARLARLRAGLGLAGLARCATRASTRSRRICTGAGRRSTTGPRTSCATSTARSWSSERPWAATARSRSPAARPSGSSAWCSSDLAPTPTRSSAGSSGRSRPSSCARAMRRPSPTPDADLEHLAVAQEAMRDRLDLTGVVASFGGPLLVCVGDRDELVSVDGSARSSRRPRSTGRSRCSPDAGHFVAVDQPARFNAVLLDFLSQWKT